MKRGLGYLLVVLVVATCASAQESVADAARRLKREKESAPKSARKAKQIFTDDDVAHSSSVIAPLPPSPRPTDLADWAQQREKEAREAEIALNKLERMNEKQLGDDAVGSTVFAGRDLWEKRLAEERDHLVKAARELIAAHRELTRAVPSGDQVRITGEAKILSEKAAEYRVTKFRYSQLVEGGQKAAAKWKEGR